MKKIPMRKCLASGESVPKKDLLRIVRTPEGEVKVDTTGKLNGKGAYLKKSLEALEIAKKKNLLSRALEVNVDEEVYKEIEKVINGQLSLLGLAYRANKIKFGESVLENIKTCQYLFIADDASDKTKERYIKKCDYYNIPYTTTYSSEQLSESLGKKMVKIVGVYDRGFKKLFIENK